MKLSDLKIGESAYIVAIHPAASQGKGGSSPAEADEDNKAFIRRLSEIGFIRGARIINNMKAPLADPIEFEIMGTSLSLRRNEIENIEVSKEPLPELPQEEMAQEGNAVNAATAVATSTTPETCECECECRVDMPTQICSCHNNETPQPPALAEKKDITDMEITIDEPGLNKKDSMSSTSTQAKNSIKDIKDIEDIEDLEGELKVQQFCKYCPSQEVCKEKKYGFRMRNFITKKWNGKTIRIALLGNPNCGKTTLFNTISGGHEKEGNFCGVTVDSKEGNFIHNGVRVKLFDLPGTYSLASYSPEEQYVEDFLKEKKTDVIVNVLDSNNLERNLYLTTQLLRLGIPMVCALNMYDELLKKNSSIEVEKLSERFGVTFIPTVSRTGKGLQEIFDKALEIKGQPPKLDKRFADIDANNTYSNYSFIQEKLNGIYKRNYFGKEAVTEKIDAVVTSRIWGFPILLILIFIIFEVTFTIGAYPMDWIDQLVGWISDSLGEHMSDNWFKDLLIDGIIAGVGGVIIFLPNILILYLFISWLEDSGYMARAAFILDRLMRSFGLHGKSFIPMILGFGCNVPAIMAARTIENRKSRLVTILIIPLFSCSARLPVYMVLAGVLVKHYAGLVIFSLYIVGILVALVLAKIFSLFLVKEKEMAFMMELPTYRLPTLRNVIKHTWEKGKQYLKKMGTIILAASIIIWALSYFPSHGKYETAEEEMEKSFIGYIGRFIEPVFKPMGANWKMDVGLLTGLGAKEVVVSTLSVLYAGEEIDTEDSDQTAMLSEKIGKDINGLAAYAYMLFTLLYFPCFATIVAIKHETGGWKWAMFTVVYTVVLAWCVSTLVYQIGSLF